MKVLKGLGTIIAAIALIVLITLLSISMVFRSVLQNDVIINAAREQIQKNYNNELDPAKKEALDKILNDKSANVVINNIIEDYLNYASDNSTGVSKKTIDSIVNFISEHKESIEIINEKTFDMKEITSDKSLKELEKTLNESFDELTESIDPEDRDIVKTISCLFTKQFKLSVMVSIVVVIILLMLISWSYYKWLLTFGISSIISGAFVLTIYILLKVLLSNIENITINPKIALISGIVEIVVGILAIVIKIKIDKE